jgi:hypothetical protein
MTVKPDKFSLLLVNTLPADSLLGAMKIAVGLSILTSNLDGPVARAFVDSAHGAWRTVALLSSTLLLIGTGLWQAVAVARKNYRLLRALSALGIAIWIYIPVAFWYAGAHGRFLLCYITLAFYAFLAYARYDRIIDEEPKTNAP